MAVPVWFDENVYLSNKLTQLGDGWDMARLKTALEEAGYSSEPEGLYRHFMDFGNAENVSPSAVFNVAEYLKAKAEQLNAMNDGQGFEGHQWDEASTLAAIQAAGMSVWDHFTHFGMFENVNPSNQFDVSDYLDAKLAQLQTAEPEAGWTMDSMLDAFRAAGLNPVEHYALFGQEEGLAAPEVPAAEKVVTDFNPYVPHNPGDVFTLTTGVDTITGTAADDTVDGVASSLSSARTLNPEDQIDGGEGNDTLVVDLTSNFNGFSGDGFLKNVENVTLNNTGSVGRTFSAKGVEGVETYTLNATDAAINLTDLAAAGITVNAQGQQKAFSIGFTADAVKGNDDALTLGLNGVGADEDHVVAVTAAGIENLTVKASADNYVDLTAAASQAIAVTGSGDLYVDAVNSTLTSFDASAAGGDVEADLSGATIATLKGGAGDDTFVVDKLAPTAVLEGGAGDDTLVLSGISGAVQPTISGFETIAVDGAGSLTISGKNVADFTALTVTDTAKVTLANMNVTDFAITATNAESGSSVTVADAMALTYNAVADETEAGVKNKTAVDEIHTAVTAGKATSATVNVGAYASQAGQLDFAAATDVTVNVASGLSADGKTELTSFNAILNANKADTLTVNADGDLGASTAFNVNAASSVIVNAAQGGIAAIKADKATDVTISAGNGLALTSSSFAGAQTVTLTQNKGALTAVGNLGKVSELTVSGADESSAITVGDLGSNTQDYDLTVSASGLAAGFTAGAVDAHAGNVVLNFADMTGKATTGTVNGAGVTVNASLLGETELDAVSATGDITINAMGLLGGNTTDAFALEVGAMTAATGSISVSFDGSNGVKLGALTAGESVTLDASGYFAEVTGSAGNDVAQVGVITADTATVIGSELQANTFASSASNAITANTLNFTGGLGVDKADLTAKDGTALVATLNTGAGNDEVTVTGETSTTSIKVSGDMGGDTGDTIEVDNSANITSAATIDLSGLKGYHESTITVGKFADTITLGEGKDTLVLDFVSTAWAADTINRFEIGSGGDVLDFSGDLADIASAGWATGNWNATGKAVILADNALVATGAVAGDATAVANLFASVSEVVDASAQGQVQDKFFLASDSAAMLITNDGHGNALMWYVDNTNGDAVADTEVHLVGTLTGVDAADLVAGNFA